MNNLILKIGLLIGIFFFTSCNSNDEPIINEAIEGAWHLKDISGGLIGLNIDYNRSEVIWKFNSIKQTVSVENNISSNEGVNLATGTYDYIIDEDENVQILYINNSKKGTLTFETNILKIDDNLAADGLATQFER